VGRQLDSWPRTRPGESRATIQVCANGSEMDYGDYFDGRCWYDCRFSVFPNAVNYRMPSHDINYSCLFSTLSCCHLPRPD
jgi:hypothetical protein